MHTPASTSQVERTRIRFRGAAAPRYDGAALRRRAAPSSRIGGARMRVIEAADVHRVLDFPALVAALRQAFGGPAGMPRRMVFRLDEGKHDAFAVLPAWNADVIGVKAFTYLPRSEERRVGKECRSGWWPDE